MGFSVDAVKQAWTPWTLEIDGVTYTERLVSVEQVRRFWSGLESPDEGTRTQAVKKLLRAAFPWRPHYVWKGDPVDKFLKLDPPLQAKALQDFFVLWTARWAPLSSRTNGAASNA
jgi:hypothetical protein